MTDITKKGIIIIVSIAAVMLILLIIGAFTIPVFGTIESLIMLLGGFFFGWILKNARTINVVGNDD